MRQEHAWPIHEIAGRLGELKTENAMGWVRDHRGLSWCAGTISVSVYCTLHSRKCPSLDDKLYCYLIFRPMKELGLILNDMGGLLEGSDKGIKKINFRGRKGESERVKHQFVFHTRLSRN